jgi:hypothetical protein
MAFRNLDPLVALTNIDYPHSGITRERFWQLVSEYAAAGNLAKARAWPILTGANPADKDPSSKSRAAMFVFDEPIVRLYREKANALIEERSLQLAAELANRGEPSPPPKDVADIRPPIWYWAKEKIEKDMRLHSIRRADDLQGIVEKSQVYASLAQVNHSPVGVAQFAASIASALATDPSHEQAVQKVAFALGLSMYKK